MNFLAAFLREEGGLEFKKSIVDSIVELMTTIPDTKETSLLHLCEFIEDCEFSELIVQILHLIGTYRHTYTVTVLEGRLYLNALDFTLGFLF